MPFDGSKISEILECTLKRVKEFCTNVLLSKVRGKIYLMNVYSTRIEGRLPA
ncbi:MAG TPA: hypothetical protein VNE86_06360 [Nitrososphaerales archaeon]|nr:hypothetical protein [Nitrososphaerales archaeon]